MALGSLCHGGPPLSSGERFPLATARFALVALPLRSVRSPRLQVRSGQPDPGCRESSTSTDRRLLPALGRPRGRGDVLHYASNAQAIRDAASSEAAQLAGELSQRMRAVTTQLSQRVETLMELPPPAETRPAASEPRAAAVVPKPAPAPAPPAAPAAPAVVQPEMAELDLKLGELAELIDNIEIRDRRPGRRFGPPPDGRGPGRPRVGRSSRRRRPVRRRPHPGRRRARRAASARTVPPAPAGPPSGPRDGSSAADVRPPPEARGRASRRRGRSTTRRIPSASASTCIWSGVSCSTSSWPIARRSTRCRSRRNRRSSR